MTSGAANGKGNGGTADESIRYPVGRFKRAESISQEVRDEALAVMEAAPLRLREAVRGLGDDQLDTSYRERGWTLRQVVHHLPDSHLNGYVRTRWALTEERPSIKVYDQADWAELSDARTAPIEASLSLMDALHARWTALLRSLGPDQLGRAFVYPDGRESSIDGIIELYAWHSRHHTAHILGLRDRRGW